MRISIFQKLLESLGTKHKTVREGDATIIDKEKFDGATILGEGSVKICERGQIIGIYCQHCKRASLLWSQKKNKKTTRKYFMKKNPKRAQWKK